MIRLFAFDLDGTMLNSSGVLSDANRAALVAAAEQGTLLVPATGRLLSFMPKDLMALPQVRYIVSSNGAVIYDRKEEKVLADDLIPTELAVKVMEVYDEFGVYYEFYDRGSAVTFTDNVRLGEEVYHFPPDRLRYLKKEYRAKVPDQKAYILENNIRPEKLNTQFVPPEIRRDLVARLRALGEMEIASSLPNTMEINAPGVCKSKGLETLCSLLGIDRADVMTLGDGENDEPMLRWAGVSVAMGNAGESTRAAAKFVTDDNDHDGAAGAIGRFILQK